MKKLIFNIIILILIYLGHSIAQQQDVWTTYNDANGLLSNNVLAIFESSDGAMWFGTDEGVSRFYHGVWTVITTEDGLADNSVSAIFESSDGAMWFGTNGGVSRFYDGVWTNLTTTEGLVHNNVRAIFESSDGAMWFGTSQGASRLYNEVWNTITTSNGLARNFVSAIFESSDGAMWFVDGVGSRYYQGGWTRLETPNNIMFSTIYAILETSDNALWVGGRSGVGRLYKGEWTIFDWQEGLTSYEVGTIIESSDEALWFGTRGGGVRRYYFGKWTQLTTVDGLADNDIYITLESSDGAIWFGTNKGANRYEEKIWITFTTADGLINNDVKAILESSDGALWFGTEGGVNRYYQGIWTSFNVDVCSAGYYDIEAICESSDRALWFGGWGVSRFDQDQGSWKYFSWEDGLGSDNVHGIIESSDEAMWFATSGGASRYFQGNWYTFTCETDSFPCGAFKSIYESSDGAIWVGTYGEYNGGASRYYDGRWTHFSTADGYLPPIIEAIMETTDGALLFGTWSGVGRFYNGDWTNFKTDEETDFNFNLVWDILESSNGALWFGTNYGVDQFHHCVWKKFTTADGLAHNEVYAICESSSDILWFGTKEGVTRLKPDKISPFTIIDEGPKNGEVIGTSTPTFIFHGFDYRTTQDRLLYAYTVTDDYGFIVAGNSLNFRKVTAVEPNLTTNGNYTFKVQAKDSWSNIDPKPATRTFTVDLTPPTTVIEYPAQNDTLSQIIPITGYTYDDSPIKDFDYYGICYGKGTAEANVADWDTLVHQNKTEIRKDTLAVWNTSGLRGTYQLKLFAYDTLDHQNQDVVTIHLVDATQEIDSRSGGSVVDNYNNIEIYFPPNSFDKDIEIKVSRIMDLNAEQIDNKNHRYAGLAYDIMPTNITSRKNGTFTLAYNDSNLIDVEDERKLNIFRYSEQNNEWNLIGGTVQTEYNKISTSIKQLGRYGLFENLQEGAKHSLTEIDCQPRVFSPRGSGYCTETNISFNLGKASNVTIKIYNTAGRLIRVLTQNEPMTHGIKVIDWDGRDGQGNFCETGLYIVTIQAENKMESKTVVVLNRN